MQNFLLQDSDRASWESVFEEVPEMLTEVNFTHCRLKLNSGLMFEHKISEIIFNCCQWQQLTFYPNKVVRQ